MNITLRAFAFFVAISILGGCTTVTTDHPIGMSGGTQWDARLIGGWKVVPADQKMQPFYAFFLPRKEGGLQAMIVGWDKTNPNDSGWETFEILTGKAGDHLVINGRPLLDNGEPAKSMPAGSGYWPLLYRFEADGTVNMFTWGTGDAIDAIKNAIRTGRITGTIEEHGQSSDIRITAEPQSLDAFFDAAAPMLFTELFATLQPIN